MCFHSQLQMKPVFWQSSEFRSTSHHHVSMEVHCARQNLDRTQTQLRQESDRTPTEPRQKPDRNQTEPGQNSDRTQTGSMCIVSLACVLAVCSSCLRRCYKVEVIWWCRSFLLPFKVLLCKIPLLPKKHRYKRDTSNCWQDTSNCKHYHIIII